METICAYDGDLSILDLYGSFTLFTFVMEKELCSGRETGAGDCYHRWFSFLYFLGSKISLCVSLFCPDDSYGGHRL